MSASSAAAELPRGLKLGPYVIDSLLGAGGMGQVYRARDDRLHRPVAIKILPAALASNADRMRRFEQEARLAGSLSHPNVMVVHDVGRYEGRPFIVEELLEGQTLRDRMRGRFFAPQRAVEIGRQIADGLAAAHARGIVHRDLKPSNIFLTDAGTVKILDFGLAKLRSHETLDDEPDTGSTTDGIMGTVGYLSPEQARGEHADHRSDIFALGCVLYEMLTGRKAFGGGSVAEILAATLACEPMGLGRAAPELPPSLSRIVHRCLEKDPSARFSSAHDLSLALESITQEKLVAPRRWTRVPTIDRRALRVAGLGLLAVALVLVAGAVVRWWTGDRLPEFTPRQLTSGLGLETQPAVSPDGQFVAYVASSGDDTDLWLADIQGGPSLQLTNDPARDESPSWFPDGRHLAFVSDRDGQDGIWKISRLGGRPTLLLPGGKDPAISPDGTRLAFARWDPDGADRIAVAPLADPGDVKVLTGSEHGLGDHRHPVWSPDGRTLCYQGFSHLWLVDVGGGEPRRLTSGDDAEYEPAWSPDGRHVYFSSFRGGIRALWRGPTGPGGQAARVTMGPGDEGWPSLSRDGHWLAYVTRSSRQLLVAIDTVEGSRSVFEEARDVCCPAVAPDGSTLVFPSSRDASADLWQLPLGEEPLRGRPSRLTDQEDPLAVPRFSHDGRWVAFFRRAEGQRDIWTVPAGGGPMRRVTLHPEEDVWPMWSPDDGEIGFISYRSGQPQIWARPVRDGEPAGEAHPVLPGSPPVSRFAWSPDGSQLAFVAPRGDVDEVWVARSGDASSARPITGGVAASDLRWLSPSGRLLVLARWGGEVPSVRLVDPVTGVDEPIPFGDASGPFSEIDYFDASADGRWMVFFEVEQRGDIWLLEATRGSF